MKPANRRWPCTGCCRLFVGAPTALLLWACAQTSSTLPPAPVAPPPAAASASHGASAPPGTLYSLFHRPLQAPPAGAEVMRLKGAGSQIFRCETQSAGLRWSFRLPEAELRDAQGNSVVHHGANLSFEHVDGSLLLSDVVDHVPSPNSDALPWLLLKTHSFHDGALAGITYVERINTVGGMPPASCTPEQLNELLRVPFSAEFVFFR
ncbi:MAG TPA: DUF3455 domain-containing protein [Burkholderiaceae bacterium]|nr:DUF3455 domain-containing protein [Burkholderiaceae bacterium]